MPLHMTGVIKRYGARVILPGVELQVGAGETVVLRGPNGTGKSTLLGCACGQIVPDAGTIVVDGHDLRQAPMQARTALRALAQEIEVPPGITGREWLGFCADVFGGSARTDPDPDDPLAEVLDHLATTYSVGLRRRLAFAGLCFGSPRLFVLDEPFAGVDVDGRAGIIAQLGAFTGRGAGVLLAAHDHELGELAPLRPRTLDVRSLAQS